jgi:hypothetical protein
LDIGEQVEQNACICKVLLPRVIYNAKPNNSLVVKWFLISMFKSP